ncbi:MAG: 50S ribosomal protein L10 [Candidatus Omnitrophica bacterium]|nr:50S ribosomal protein L10 [Candidatus Omnitrophota bacterium]
MATLEKQGIINQFTREIEDSSGIFLFRFNNFSAQNADGLRTSLSEIGSGYRVVKNRIFRRALSNTQMGQLRDLVDGPIGMAFIKNDPAATAKKIHDCCKENEGLQMAGGWFAGRLFSGPEVEVIAALPPRQVLLAKVVSGIAAPICGLVNVLKGNLTALVCTLNSIREKKDS